MKTFYLLRDNQGVVAEGVKFLSGKCVMHWLSEPSSVAFFDSQEELEEIHGHGGATRIVFKLGEERADDSRDDQN